MSNLNINGSLEFNSLVGKSLTELLNKIYPINSIYMSIGDTSPAEFLGGTWEKIKDKFLLASGDTYTNGDTGGSADAVVVSHTHTLKSLTDNGFTRWGTNVGGSATYVGPVGGTTTYESGGPTMWNDNTGVDGIGKNMPPYLVVNVWKRIS